MADSYSMGVVHKALAKEIVSARRTVNRLYENKAQMNSISMHLGESVGNKQLTVLQCDCVISYFLFSNTQISFP